MMPSCAGAGGGREQVVHAAAVDQRERRDVLLHAILEDLEIVLAQVGDELVGVVPDDDVHVDQIDADREIGPFRLRLAGLLRWCSRRLAGGRLGGKGRSQSQDQGETRSQGELAGVCMTSSKTTGPSERPAMRGKLQACRPKGIKRRNVTHVFSRRYVRARIAGFAAQTPPAQPPKPKGQMPDLGRPTKDDDTVPLFDFDAYFPGKWTFEWDVPEGPLGPAGRLEGTTVYTALGGGVYQAMTDATGPAGKFTIKEAIAYQREQKTLTRDVTDSRGFWYSQNGTIGGDLGGFYTIYFESEPFKASGKSVRLKHAMRLTVAARPIACRRRCRWTADRSRTTARRGGGRGLHVGSSVQRAQLSVQCVWTVYASRVAWLTLSRGGWSPTCTGAGRRRLPAGAELAEAAGGDVSSA